MNKTLTSIRNFAYKTVDEIGYRVGGFIPPLLVGYMIFSLGSHNGCLDSDRTGGALRHQNPSNPIKTVVSVEEEWSDNSALSMISGGVYNPHVRREITFEDGSKAMLSYRTQAWQPIRRWLRGEEFNPKPGEKYEVVSGDVGEIVWSKGLELNRLDKIVRRVE